MVINIAHVERDFGTDELSRAGQPACRARTQRTSTKARSNHALGPGLAPRSPAAKEVCACKSLRLFRGASGSLRVSTRACRPRGLRQHVRDQLGRARNPARGRGATRARRRARRRRAGLGVPRDDSSASSAVELPRDVWVDLQSPPSSRTANNPCLHDQGRRDHERLALTPPLLWTGPRRTGSKAMGGHIGSRPTHRERGAGRWRAARRQRAMCASGELLVHRGKSAPLRATLPR